MLLDIGLHLNRKKTLPYAYTNLIWLAKCTLYFETLKMEIDWNEVGCGYQCISVYVLWCACAPQICAWIGFRNSRFIGLSISNEILNLNVDVIHGTFKSTFFPIFKRRKMAQIPKIIKYSISKLDILFRIWFESCSWKSNIWSLHQRIRRSY